MQTSPDVESKYPEFEQGLFESEGKKLPYRLLKPKNYRPGTLYPVVMFYHGAGERGQENEITLTHIAKLFLDEKNREEYPCFVIVPQCPKNKRWVEVDWSAKAHTQPEEISWPLELSVQLLDKLSKKYTFDSNRYYLTGLSMGGFACWDILARHPGLFTAAIPICGGGDIATASKMKDIPIWAFHGAKDGVVQPERSRQMVKALKELGSGVKYTEYPGVYHDSWKPAYREADLLKWLFQQLKD